MTANAAFTNAILASLQQRQMYHGTVAPGVVELRRAANKRARLARRGKGQHVAGHSPAVRKARYAALSRVAARAGTVRRQQLGGAA